MSFVSDSSRDYQKTVGVGEKEGLRYCHHRSDWKNNFEAISLVIGCYL